MLTPVLVLFWNGMAGEGGSPLALPAGVAWPLPAEFCELMVELRVMRGAPAKGEARVDRGEGIRLCCLGEKAPNLMVAASPSGSSEQEVLELPPEEKMASGDWRLG